MSASYVVDLGGTTQSYPSILGSGTAPSSTVNTSSGATIGVGVDLINANSFCNVLLAGVSFATSGQAQVQIQVSDSDVSGNYTDPTSGLAQFPTWFASGGLLWLNSGGLLGGTLQGAVSNTGSNSGLPQSGYAVQSGFQIFAGFQRIGRFARANILSGGFFQGSLSVGFVSQLKITGSGGGFTFNPGSGAINV